MRKKLISIITAICMLCAALSGSALADDTENRYKIPDTPIELEYIVLDGEIKITNTWGIDLTNVEGQVRIPDSIDGITVRSIGGHAFSCLSGELKNATIVIPQTVGEITDFAFYGSNCKFAVDIENPYFASIKGSLFSNDLSQLIRYYDAGYELEYTVPSTVRVICDYAFTGICYLDRLTIPASVQIIEESAFEYAYFYDYAADVGSEYFCSVDGVLFSKDMTTLIKCPYEMECDYVIPNTVTKICAYAFDGCYIYSVKIPNSVTEIGSYAFTCCIPLTSVTIPKSVNTIGEYAFGFMVHIKVKDFTITGIKGSAAESYAKKYDFKFIPLSDGNSGSGSTGGNIPAPPSPDITKIYSDISASAWYIDAVKFVTDRKLMNGTGDGKFAPDSPLTRIMPAQVLYNNAGRPAVSGDFFTDVSSGKWYTDAAVWAGQNGIISGYGDGSFGINDLATRQQLAVILFNHAGKPAVKNTKLNFRDADSVSPWAYDAVCWAVENGIMSGYDGILDPTGNATRAQAAQLFMNYFK